MGSLDMTLRERDWPAACCLDADGEIRRGLVGLDARDGHDRPFRHVQHLHLQRCVCSIGVRLIALGLCVSIGTRRLATALSPDDGLAHEVISGGAAGGDVGAGDLDHQILPCWGSTCLACTGSSGISSWCS